MPFAMADARSMSKTWLVIQARNYPRADDSDARQKQSCRHPRANSSQYSSSSCLVYWRSTAAQLLQDIGMAPVGRGGFAGKDTLMTVRTVQGWR